ncbi:PREDICTED: DNA transposase THAP9 isoform X2 [Atta colombica]|uniref:DNA transposase THAP9 isoform X2 n=1 Tax=Atta colombica TaxID=520822 RepID=UPI00084C035B|nr:PREDICTED: DNA transposase THAP9 isoform X2 [Atta colombica]
MHSKTSVLQASVTVNSNMHVKHAGIAQEVFNTALPIPSRNRVVFPSSLVDREAVQRSGDSNFCAIFCADARHSTLACNFTFIYLIVTMPSCAVRNCKNNSWNTKRQKISYLSFPKETEMIEKWKIVCKEDVNSKFARICSKHFHPSQFEDKSWLQDFVGKSGNVRIKLKRDAVPLIAVEDNKISMDNDLEVDVAQPVAHCSFNPGIDCTALTSTSSCITQAALNTAVVPNIEISQEMQKLQHRNATLFLETKALSGSETETHKRQQALKDKLYKKQLIQKMQDKLTLFFTPEQIELFLNLTQKIRWTKEDIEAAISLKSVLSKAYKYLRKTKQFPATSTLRKWITDFNIDKGILTDESAMTKKKNRSMTEMRRAFYSDEISSFDEIYLSNQVQIEESKEKVYVYVVLKN